MDSETNEFADNEVFSDYEENKPVYNKYEFYSSDGIFIGYGNKLKVKFYSKHPECCNIDHILKRITFNKPFDPSKIKSKIHYDKENICVCCGDDYDLSSTRIIPQCYVRHFPPEINIGSENHIAVCKYCLNKINHYLTEYKNKLYLKYNIDVRGLTRLDELVTAYKNCLKYIESLKKSSDNIDKLERRIAKVLKPLYFDVDYHYKIKISQEEIEKFVEDVEKNNFIDPKKDYLTEELFSKIEDFGVFKDEWIKNFLEKLDVKYMPRKI